MKKKRLLILGTAFALVLSGCSNLSSVAKRGPLMTAAGDVEWSRVTSVDALLAGGTFILGHEATANSGVIIPMANTGSATTSSAGFMYTGSSASSGGTGTINMSTVTNTSSFEVTIGESTSVDGAIFIKAGDNYIGNANTKNNCKLFTTQSASTSFAPTMKSGDKVELKIDDNATYTHLQYNTGSPRFAVYGNTQQNPVIYQKIITQGITGSTSGQVGVGVELTTNAPNTTQWSFTSNTAGASLSSSTGSSVTINATQAGSVTVKAVCAGYTDATHTITFESGSSNPFVTPAKNSTSGYTGQNENISFTYGYLAGLLSAVSDDNSVVTTSNFSAEGGSGSVKLNFVGAGTTDVKFLDGENVLASIEVSVTASSVTIDGLASSSSVYVGRTLDLGSTITVTAVGSYSNAVTWSSDDESIATVNPLTGVVTGVAEGTVDITVSSDDYPSETATCSVTVATAPLSYSIQGPAQVQNSGSALTLDNLKTWYPIDDEAYVEWTGVSGNAYGSASSSVRFGTSTASATGYITLSLKAGAPIYFTSVTVNAKTWSSETENTLKVNDETAAVTSSWDDYEFDIDADATSINFGNGSKRVNIYSIEVYYARRAPEITANPSSFELSAGRSKNVEITVANYTETPSLECDIQSGASSIDTATVGSVNGSNKATATITATFTTGDAVVRVRDVDHPDDYYVDLIITVASVRDIIETSVTTRSSLSYDYDKQAVVDKLTSTDTGITGVNYSSWSDVAKSSGAVYAGQSAGGADDNPSIQLRVNNNNSGIITTTTGGNAKQVSVVWNSASSAGKGVEIYGKNEPYSSPTDLYTDNSKGTLLGTISYGSRPILDIVDDYAYIGIKSSSGTAYLDSIDIQWGDATYTYSSVYLRFGGFISVDLWDALNSESTIVQYGVMITTAEYLGEGQLKDKFGSTDENDLANINTYHTDIPGDKLNPGVAHVEENSTTVDYYVWNLRKAIAAEDKNNLKIEYVSVAYIKTANGVVTFLQQTSTSAKKLAQAMIDDDTNSYDADSFKGSLGNIANL